MPGSPGRVQEREYSGNGGAATNAELAYPTGVAVDAAGNLFIADLGNARIRMVNPGGTITTIAGNGVTYFSGDGGPATNATFNSPSGVAVDAYGNLFIADSGNNRIRKMTVNGLALTLANTSAANAGTYQVIVSNAWGSVTSSVVTLTVNLPPVITQQPVSQRAVGGGNVAFTATATGTAPLAWHWFFNGNGLTGQTNSSLVLTAVSATNAGVYQVVVTNLCGSVVSSNATLSVANPAIACGINPNGSVTLNLLTAGGSTSRVLAATNLTPPVVWQPIYTNIPGANGSWQLTITNTAPYPARFYRTATP